MSAPRRRRAGAFAWLAALTVTMVAVTPLLAIFHQMAARHAVCEHGELIESGHNGSSRYEFDGLNVEFAAPDTSAPTTGIRADSDSASHGHDHCSVAALVRSSVGVLPCDDGVKVLCEIALSSPHPDDLAYVRTLLLDAPKTSPPHATS